jgi:hypothetical protein
LWKRAQFVERYHWTFEQYDRARAGDIAFQETYFSMMHPVAEQRAATE